MDKTVCLVELPELKDEVLIPLYDFLQAALLAFESHYYGQLQRAYKASSPDNISDDLS